MNLYALISIKPGHVCSIKTGQKLAEIRNRKVHMPKGTCLWIYSTLPKGCIEVVATVAKVDSAEPDTIWNIYGEQADIDQATYRKYINGSLTSTAILLENVKVIPSPITLEELRSISAKFTPPQFYKYLAEEDSLMRYLSGRLAEFEKAENLISNCLEPLGWVERSDTKQR